MRGCKMKSKSKAMSGVKLLLIVFFAVAVLFPLIRMFFSMAGTDIGAILTSDNFNTALLNSLSVTLTSTVISVGRATALALSLIHIL